MLMNTFMLFLGACFIDLPVISCSDRKSLMFQKELFTILHCTWSRTYWISSAMEKTDSLVLASLSFTTLSPTKIVMTVVILELQYYFFRILHVEGKFTLNPRHAFLILIKIPISCDSRLLAYDLATNFFGAKFILSNLAVVTANGKYSEFTFSKVINKI